MTVQTTQVTPDTSAENTLLSTPVVISRAAQEVEVIEQYCADLEAGLLSFLPLSTSTEARVALQSLDIIQQSLNNLTKFLVASAENENSGHVEINTALINVTLGDMRARLSQTSKTE